jgi:hypothetical protein
LTDERAQRGRRAPSQKAAELEAEARHAAERLALYQQRVYAGRADGRRLAELQRAATGAADRAARGLAAETDGDQARR